MMRQAALLIALALSIANSAAQDVGGGNAPIWLTLYDAFS